MAIRPGANAPLGISPIGAVADTPHVPVGTVITGMDDTTGVSNEYILLKTPAGFVANDEGTYDATYTATKVAAGAGQGFATVASVANTFQWFKLKPRKA